MSRRAPLVLALDVGTSSVRSALFDTRARLIPDTLAQRGYRLRVASPGMAELDPRALLDAVRQSIASTLAVRGGHSRLAARPVTAVGTSCFWHSVLGVDGKGKPLTPVYTWADARCAPDAERLRRQVAESEIHAMTGCMVRPSFWPAKLAWLRRTERSLFRRVAVWLSPAEWLYWRLAGVRGCAIGMATGTGLLDPQALDWRPELLELSGIDTAQLLPLADAPQPMSAAAARRWPELAGALWCPGIGDGAAGNLGSGADRPGTAALNYGTSAAVRVMRRGRAARAPFGLFAYRVDATRFLVGGAVSNAGNLRAWCLETLRLDGDPGAVERALARRPGPDHGLTVLPFLNAERAPTWREDMTGCVAGLRPTSTPLDILQALTEASFHRLAQIAERVPGGRRAHLLVSGGLARSRPGLSRLANVLGRPVRATRESEASLRGAAVRALELLGVSPPSPPLGPTIVPDPTLARRYRRARASQRELEERVYPPE